MDSSSQQTLELTLKASNAGICDWAVGSEEIYYSDRIYEFFGTSPEHTPNIMLHPERIVFEEDVAYFKNVLDLTLLDEDEEFFGIDCRINHTDGSLRWLRIRGVVLWEHGNPRRIVSSVIDISKRKSAEDDFQEERNMLRLIIDNIPQQVYFKDLKSRYVLVNQQQAEWVGASHPDELIGKSQDDFFSADYAANSKQLERDIIRTGKPLIDVIQQETWNDKEDTYVQTVKQPWLNTHGETVGLFGISCDVTNLVAAQKKLESLALDLQQKHHAYEEELMLAREVQHALLPYHSDDWEDKVSSLGEHAKISYQYTPATELAGDYFDIISIDEHKVGFFLCDVMGHGVRSAIIVSMIKGLMERASDIADDPSAYLSQINAGLVRLFTRSNITLFATACYMVLDFKKGECQFASAGHDHPIIEFYDATQTTKELSKGVALGILADGDYQSHRFSLATIRKFLLFTDGIYESENNHGEEWGIERLETSFRRHDTAQQGIYAAYYDAVNWTGENGFNDDVCMLAVDIIPTLAPNSI